MGKISIYVLLLSAAALTSCDDKTEYPDSAVFDAGQDSAIDSAVDQAPPDTVPPEYCEVVKTPKGPVQGKRQDKSCVFLGIPFAKPPEGPLRWKHAEPPDAWTKVLVADTHKNACWQFDPPGKWGNKSEDCLTINVWAPDPRPEKPAPVLVWINKGVYFDSNGSAQTPWTDGTSLAEDHGLVVVTFNWRLGVLGFLAHPALGPGSGNYGFVDQIRALEWIRDNISVFGGDPDRVTIYGGAFHGAVSVCTHMVSEKSKGLFHRAIMESGHCPRTWPPVPYKEILTQAEAEAQGQEAAKAAGCDTGTATDVAACLRSKTWAQLAGPFPVADWWDGQAKGKAIWGPIVDGVYLKGIPADLIKAGQVQSKVPLIMGSNLDQGYFGGMNMDATAWAAALTNQWGAVKAQEILLQYPTTDYSPRPGCKGTATTWAAADCHADGAYRCPQRRIARALTGLGVPVYLYHYTLPISYCTPPNCPRACPNTGTDSFKVLPFNTPQQVPPTEPPGWGQWQFSEDEKKLVTATQGYWKHFAETGDPNDTTGSGVAWPKYDQTTDMHLEFGTSVVAKGGLKKAKCDFWDTMNP